MKKNSHIILFIFVVNFSFSQNVTLHKNEVEKLLCQSWNFDYGLSNGVKIQGLETANQEYSFNANNSYKLIGADSFVSSGTWKFVPEKKRIELYLDNGNSSGYIKFISENQFILIPGENSVPETVNLEFFFYPKK